MRFDFLHIISRDMLFVSHLLEHSLDSTKYRTATRPKPEAVQEGGNVDGEGELQI